MDLVGEVTGFVQAWVEVIGWEGAILLVGCTAFLFWTRQMIAGGGLGGGA